MRFVILGACLIALAVPAAAQQGASLSELAATPVVTVRIGELLRAPPDQATMSFTAQSRATTAAEAFAANRLKTATMLTAIRAAGIGTRDIQTEGVSLSPDYAFETVAGRNNRRLAGYTASSTIEVKTGRIDLLSALIDQVTAAGAEQIRGPNFSISDPLPLRRQARQRGMARGQAEALEYAQSAGFARVELLSVDQSVSNRSSDIVVMGSSQRAPGEPPPAPAAPTAGRGGIEPGQIETGITLILVYRMVK